MKRLILVAIVALFIPTISCSADLPWEVNLPFDEATIKYDLSGMEEGTETLYIRGNGQETAVYHDGSTTMMGMTMETKTVEFITPDWVYSYDLGESSGSKSANPETYMTEEYNKLSSAEKKQVLENAESMGINTVQGMGGTVEKSATKILGYRCDKVSIMGSISYVIHGTDVPLKTEVNTMGMTMSVTASSIDKGRVDAKYFKHPAGIKAYHDKDADIAARAIAQQTIAMLKDPEGVKPQGSAQQQQRMDQIPEEDKDEMEQAMQMMKGLFGN